MDSKELADRVADSFNGLAPTIAGGVDVHAIIKATLEELARAGIIDLEEGEIQE